MPALIIDSATRVADCVAGASSPGDSRARMARLRRVPEPVAGSMIKAEMPKVNIDRSSEVITALIIVPATPAQPPAELGSLAGVLGVVSVRAGEADRGFGLASRTSALARERRSVRRRWFRQVAG